MDHELSTDSFPDDSPGDRRIVEDIEIPSFHLIGRKIGLYMCGIVIVSLVLVAVGVHIGAHGEDHLYTGAVLWLADLLRPL